MADPLALTTAELLLAGSGFCPDCEKSEPLIGGPKGGMNQNFACGRCGAEFNIAKLAGQTVWGQRLSPFGVPNLARVKSIYGIKL